MCRVPILSGKLLLLFLFTGIQILQSQVYIAPGETVYLSGGDTFSADSLSFTPSSAYSFTSNTFSRSTTLSAFTLNTYIKRVYRLPNPLTGFSGAVKIFYTDGAELNGIPENLLTLNVHSAGGWTAYNSGITRDGVSNSVLTTGLVNQNLQEITLANANSPLPLHWIRFTATEVSGSVLLNWIVYEDINTIRYTVECSNDGSHFSDLGSVTARRREEECTYTYTDTRLLSGLVFYRIRSTNMAGGESLSNMIAVQKGRQEMVRVFPNPTQGWLFVTAPDPGNNAYQIILSDNRGQILMTQNQCGSSTAVDMRNLSAGIYQLEIRQNNTRVAVTRVIKQ